MQNLLLDYCGLNTDANLGHNEIMRKTKLNKFKRLPTKSPLLHNFQPVEGEQPHKKLNETVKFIGLDPKELHLRVPKYQIDTDCLPRYSCVFDKLKNDIPGLSMTVNTMAISSNSALSHARADGKSVISLHFNPYQMNNQSKQRLYDNVMKEIIEQRDKMAGVSKQSKEKQEAQFVRRAWTNIVKKDIPKAFRIYQKYKQDVDNNGKKQSSNCMKEVKKRAVRTQRFGKDAGNRAKKLQKEVLSYWRKRDKELADTKRKKEKMDREIRKKIEEEQERNLQKKRLEFIMQQSDIYAHFMARKMGLLEEQKLEEERLREEEMMDQYERAEVDNQQCFKNAAEMINEQRKKVIAFDNDIGHRKQQFTEIREEDLEVDKFDNPDDQALSKSVECPKMFKGRLKEYQLKGLRWLDNLYEQGINGILADEMGLGKTIQAIALLAHLAENKGVWGPFLIIAPATTLHNWWNELQTFCPALSVLPYWGPLEDRKQLRKFFCPKNLNHEYSSVHVVISSYSLIQTDEKFLQRVKWHYMILDEAQAIKNNSSMRWKTLLSFTCRNRLLLTGTPIQNSMAELWALLHFIMPKLFDSHEQFQEWFSKDIEANSSNPDQLSKHQLKRLHTVLKPFMLRRLKKDVEQEIGPKVEHEIHCDMTHRQRVLYQRIKNKISTKDLFQLVDSKQKVENLMNLVMQFRKVCNHPDLFERRLGKIPFLFRDLAIGVVPNQNLSQSPEVRNSFRNPIELTLPKLVFDECFIGSTNSTSHFRKLIRNEGIEYSEVGTETHFKFFNIFNEQYLQENVIKSGKQGGSLGALRLLMLAHKWGVSDLSYLFVADPLIRAIALAHSDTMRARRQFYSHLMTDGKSPSKVEKYEHDSYLLFHYTHSADFNPMF